MKSKITKISIIFVSLLLIALYSLNEIYSYRNDMTLKRTLICGEMPNIEGLEIKAESNWAGMFENVISLGSDFNYETKFRYFKEEKEWPIYLNFSTKYFSDNSGYSFGGNRLRESGTKEFTLKFIREEMDRLSEYERKLYIDMVKNDESSRIVSLKDSHDYLPIHIESHNVFDEVNNSNNERYDSIYEDAFFNDYFKFPVKDDMKLKYQIEYAIGSIDTRRELLEPYSHRSLFEIYDAVDQKKLNVIIGFSGTDIYSIPEKYEGLFVMPLKELTVDSGIEPIKIGKEYMYNQNDIKKIYDFEKGENIFDIMIIEKAREIFVVSEKTGANNLYIFDADKLELKEKVELYGDKVIERVKLGHNGLIVVYEDGYYQWTNEKTHEIYADKLPNEILKLKKGYEVELSDIVFYDKKLCFLYHNVDAIRLLVMTKGEDYSLVRYDFPKRKGSNLDYHGDDISNMTNEDRFYPIWEEEFTFKEKN